MGKVKKEDQCPYIVKIEFWIADDSQNIQKQCIDFELKGDYITYDDILPYYENFLDWAHIKFPTIMYYVPQDEHEPHEKITPSFSLDLKVFEEIGFLFIFGKSTLYEFKLELQEEIRDLQKKIESLENEVRDLMSFRSEFEFYKKNSAPYNRISHLSQTQSFHQNQFQENPQIDIAILFSEPLFNDQYRVPVHDPVDFRSQIARLKLALSNSYTPAISMKCEIGRSESLRNVIRISKPKILHIVCHGTEQGWIELEDDSISNLGFINFLKPEDIKRLLKDSVNTLPDLVFVNSCHSEKIGKAFYQLGVKAVVIINSEDVIGDKAAQLFSEQFYRYLFNGQQISKAFKFSKEDVGLKYKSQACCCNEQNHGIQQPHRSNCRWTTVIQKRLSNPHKTYHIPSSQCTCPKRHFNRHKTTCQWALKTLFEINPDYRIKDVTTGKDVIRLNPDQKQLFICCCPNGKTPHNQIDKFKLLIKEQDQTLKLSEPNNERNRDLFDLTASQLSESVFKAKNITGRRNELYSFLKQLSLAQNPIHLIYGKTGVGLTSFAVKAASYALQRKRYEYYFFVDLYQIKEQTVFRFKFNQITGLKYSGSGTIHSGIKEKKILILFDNCDEFLKYAPEQFYSELNTLHKELNRSAFIIILKENSMHNFNTKRLLCGKFQLKPLDVETAKLYLMNKIMDKTDISVGIYEYKKLIKQFPALTIPINIENLSESLPQVNNYEEKSTRANYETIVMSIKKQMIEADGSQLVREVLEKLKKSSFQAYQLLIFVSQFSDGITYEDLDMFSSYDRKNSNFQLPIKSNWRTHFPFLLKNNQDKSNTSTQSGSEESLSETEIKIKNTTSCQQNFSQFPEYDKVTEHENEVLQKKSQISESLEQIDIKQESYFIEKMGKKKFVVKRFIRDFVWNKYYNKVTHRIKFLYIVYFSVVLELMFKSLKQNNSVHEELLTYSEFSQSGIFSFCTGLEALQTRRSLTESTRIARDIMSEIEQIFINSDLVNTKFKKGDPITFILNHKQDFLNLYDLEWKTFLTHDYGLEKDEKPRRENQMRAEDRLMLFLLESLMVYIPSAFKIAHKNRQENEELLKFVLSRSNNSLEALRKDSKDLLRSIKIQLKVFMMEMGVVLEKTHYKKSEKIEEYEKIKRKVDELISKYSDKLKFMNEFEQIKTIMREEMKNSELYINYQCFSPHEDIYDIIRDSKENFEKLEQKQTFDQIIMAKQALLISMLYLKYVTYTQPQLIVSKKNKQVLFNTINRMCQLAQYLFSSKECRKLKLKADLTAIEIEWKYKLKFDTQGRDVSEYNQHLAIDSWRIKLMKCEDFYQEERNRLGSFSEFDDTIKILKKQIKERLWRLAQNTIIFMKAYPLCSEGLPIISNLVRKKNNFRKEMEKILSEKVKQKNFDPRFPANNVITLDISTKFQILTRKKLEEEIQNRCSIMVLSCNFRIINQRVYMISEGEFMNEELIQINATFASSFTSDRVVILIICGQNAKIVAQLLQKYSSNPPVIIALENTPEQSLNELGSCSPINSQWIRQSFLEEAEIREAESSYLKYLIKKITRSKIQDKKQVMQIHTAAKQKLKNKKVKAQIFMNRNIRMFLSYKKGTYKDLSPGYISNNNIDTKFFDQSVILRRWKKMTEILQYLKGEKIDSHSYHYENNSMVKIDSVDSEDGTSYNMFEGFRVNTRKDYKAAYINIFGEPGSGKTYFINELSKILVEREVYNYGVFVFKGKTIEVKYNGNFENYIQKESSQKRMPTLDGFKDILGEDLLLIIDDFNYIKPRTNAKMKLFIDKILQNNVNLILVSTNELNLEWISNLKVVKLDKLDELQNEILAHNILNIHSQEEIIEYEKMKKSKQGKVTTKDVKEMTERNRNRRHQDDRREYKEAALFKKTHSTTS